MIEELFKLKVACLLHDPTIKPLLFRARVNHENIAKEITDEINKRFNLDININKDVIRKADWIASSTDRFIITELYDRNKVSVINEVYAVNILSMKANRLDDTIFDKLIQNWVSRFKDEFINWIFKDPNKIYGLSNKLHIIYHIFWRFLIDATVKSFNIKEMSLLPADTRVPYYTIYDHLYATSAFVLGAKDNGRIGIIHWEAISIQGFIQESRAFRDLWASSFLISLLNTIVIIKLAKEYGFDSILAPNMLYNPLVDLYLYSHTSDERLRIKHEDLRILATPDKGFAVVPYDSVNQYVKNVVNWINEGWRIIICVVKDKIKKEIERTVNTNIDPYHYSLCKYFNIDDDNLITRRYIEPLLTWDGMWEEFITESPIKFVCVGENFELEGEKLHKKLKELIDQYNIELNHLYEIELGKLFDDLKKLRIIARGKYKNDLQFFEFPLTIEILKKKRKLVAEMTKLNSPEWVIRSRIYVKDRRLLCSICYKRPAVIFYCKEFGKKIPIREDERLCPVCLTKRYMASIDVFDDILAKLLNFADNSLDENEYKKTIKKVRDDEYRSHIIPSLDTFATLTFINSLIKYTDDKLKNEIYEILLKLVDDENDLSMDMPDKRWFSIINNDINRRLLIGGKYFIIDELRKEYKDKIDLLKELENKYKDASKKITNYLKMHRDTINDNVVVTTPGKYAALIRADGDDMGKLITLSSTKYKKSIKSIIPDELSMYLHNHDYPVFKDNEISITIKDLYDIVYMPGPSFYAYISRTLSSIARFVADLSTQYATYVVYAGGDDILAISPVELSLFFSHRARELFSKDWIEYNDKVIITGLGTKSTQSFTIRYFHVFEPLSKVLQDSYIDLEEKAKNLDEKNGLVLTYKARSGNIKCGTLHWKDCIVEKIYELASLTLPYKTERLMSLKRDISSTLSNKAFVDALNIIDNIKDFNIVYTIILHEFKRHIQDDDLIKLVLGNDNKKLDDVIKSNDTDNNKKETLLIIELLKGTYALLNALDSNPLSLGEKL